MSNTEQRLQRTSVPTPPEPSNPKKAKTSSRSSESQSMDDSSILLDPSTSIHDLIPQQFKISDEDIQKIADAVKHTITKDIELLIYQKTAPLFQRIENLETENRQLKRDLDALEQYGRRSLIRVTGVKEEDADEDTDALVCEILGDIDPEFNTTDVERSHRVGKASAQVDELQSAEPQEVTSDSVPEPVKVRQIIVRLKNPVVKRRILQCRRNLKQYDKRKDVYINEDLTQTRNMIHAYARKLYKRKTISQVWTVNGNIRIKDKSGMIHQTNTMEDFRALVAVVDPVFTYK